MRKQPKLIEKDGKLYVVIDDNVIPVDGLDASGVPIVKVDAREIQRPDGSQDVIVKVPCLTIAGTAKEPDDG